VFRVLSLCQHWSTCTVKEGYPSTFNTSFDWFQGSGFRVSCLGLELVVHGGHEVHPVAERRRTGGAALGHAALTQRLRGRVLDLAVAAQAEFESKVSRRSSYYSCKRLAPGAFNMGFIGSTCTALPSAPPPRWPPASPPAPCKTVIHIRHGLRTQGTRRLIINLSRANTPSARSSTSIQRGRRGDSERPPFLIVRPQEVSHQLEDATRVVRLERLAEKLRRRLHAVLGGRRQVLRRRHVRIRRHGERHHHVAEPARRVMENKYSTEIEA